MKKTGLYIPFVQAIAAVTRFSRSNEVFRFHYCSIVSFVLLKLPRTKSDKS